MCISTAQLAQNDFPGVRGHFLLVNFYSKWLLCNVHVHFDCAGSHKVSSRSWDRSSSSASSSSTSASSPSSHHHHPPPPQHPHHHLPLLRLLIIIIITIIIITILINIIININIIISILTHYPFTPPTLFGASCRIFWLFHFFFGFRPPPKSLEIFCVLLVCPRFCQFLGCI